MAIDVDNETLWTLHQAARSLPRSFVGLVSPSILYRWIRSGLKTPHGKVRLEALRLGGRWVTSSEALQRFVAALTPARAATANSV